MRLEYLGKEPIDHRTGHWEPGQVRELPTRVALALLAEKPGVWQEPAAQVAAEKPAKKKEVK